MNILKEKLNESKFDNNYSKNIISAEKHFLKLFEVCNNSWHHSWGSYLFDGYSYQYCIDTYDKQKLLFDKIVLISNGDVKSGQSENFNFTPIINDLSNNFKNIFCAGNTFNQIQYQHLNRIQNSR